MGAAVAGAVDDLRGLKENVILGRRIPAGTGDESCVNARIKHVSPYPLDDVAVQQEADEVMTDAQITAAVQQALTGRS